MKTGIDLLQNMKRKKILIIVSICVASLLLMGGIVLGIFISNANKIKLTFASDSYTTIVSLDGKELPNKIKKGKEVSFKVNAVTGYVVDVVLINNEPLQPNQNQVYTLKINDSDKDIGILSKGRVANLSSISVTGELEHKIQYDGEIFNPSGLKFNRIFEDGTIKDLPNSFLNFPKLVYGKPVTITYNSQIITIQNIEIKYSIVFNLGNFAKFEETQLSILKIGYDGIKENLTALYPNENKIVILNGSRVGALKGWKLVSDEEQKNLVYEPIWNYLDNFVAQIVTNENKPILNITSNILVCEGFELLKVKIGNTEAKCEVVGNTLSANIDLSLLETITTSAIIGSQILVVINENISVAVPSYVDLETTTCNGYTYEITKSSENKVLIKKIADCDYQIEYSKLEFNQNTLNISLQVFDYITQTKQNLKQGTEAKILIGNDYKLNAVIDYNSNQINASFNLEDFTISNSFEKKKEYQLKIELTYNGLNKILEIPVGVTNIDDFKEFNECYFTLTKSANSNKVYLSCTEIKKPDISITGIEIIKSNNDYILTITGTAYYINSLRIMVQNGTDKKYGNEIFDINYNYTCIYNLSNLDTSNNPTYDLYLIANNNENYIKKINASTYTGELVFETNLINNEINIYTIIKNTENDTLHIKAEKQIISKEILIEKIEILQIPDEDDYKLQITGTCQNITELYIICDTKKDESALIQNNEFVLTFSLDKIDTYKNKLYVSIVIDGDEQNSQYLEYGNASLEKFYSFKNNSEETITKYEILNLDDYLVIVKTIEENYEIDYDITSMEIIDLVLTIKGITLSENIDSIYILICESSNKILEGTEGINVNIDRKNFSCQLDLKDLPTTENKKYKAYFIINSNQKIQIENSYLKNENYFNEENTYKYLITDTQYLEIEGMVQENIIPEFGLEKVEIRKENSDINLILTGIAKKINSLTLNIYIEENIFDTKEIDISNENFTLSYIITNLDENQKYLFKVNVNGINRNIEIKPEDYKEEYNTNTYLVFSTSVEQTLTITKIYQEKENPICNITSVNIEYIENKPILKIGGIFNNINSVLLKCGEALSTSVEAKQNETIILEFDLTLLTIEESCYIEIEYTDLSNQTEADYLKINFENLEIEANIYEYDNGEQINLYEVALVGNEKFLVINTTVAEESNYEGSVVSIDNDLQIIKVTGQYKGIRTVQLEIGNKKDVEGYVYEETDNYLVTFDLRLLETDDLIDTYFIMIIINSKGYKLEDATLQNSNYEKTIEGVTYKTFLSKNEKDEILIKREIDKSNVPYSITNTQITDRYLFVEGTHNGVESIQLLACDSLQTNYDYPYINNQITATTFNLGIDLISLERGKSYNFKLKINENFYTVENKGFNLAKYSTILGEIEYIFTIEREKYNYLKISLESKQVEEKSITNLILELDDNEVALIVRGTVTGIYEEIYIKSSSINGQKAIITNNTFIAKFNLTELTKQNDYNYFSIVADGNEIELINSISNLYLNDGRNIVDINLEEGIKNIYTVKISEKENESTDGKLVIIFTQQQIEVSNYNIEKITFVGSNLRVEGTVQNVSNIYLKINNSVKGISNINNKTNTFDIILDLSLLTTQGNYNVYIVKDNLEELLSNINIETNELYIDNGNSCIYETSAYIYTYTVISNAITNNNLVLNVNFKPQLNPQKQIENIEIKKIDSKIYLVVSVSNLVDIKYVQLKIGELLGDKITIQNDNQTNFYEVKIELTKLQSANNLAVKILCDSNEENLQNKNFLDVDNIVSNEALGIITEYVFNIDNDDKLYITLRQRDLLIPEINTLTVDINSDLGVNLIISGKSLNVNRIELLIYLQNSNVYQKEIFAEILQDTFTIKYNLEQLEQNYYYFELVLSNDDTQKRQFIIIDSIQEKTFENIIDNEIHSYKLSKYTNDYLLLTYYIKPVPTVTFKNIYFNDQVPYIYFDVEVKNATKFEIYTENTTSEYVDGVYIIRLIELEAGKEYTFTYKLDDMEEKPLLNSNLIEEGEAVEYEVIVDEEKFIYNYSVVKKLDNLLYLAVEMVEEVVEIEPWYQIIEQTIIEEGNNYVLKVNGIYNNISTMQIIATTDTQNQIIDNTYTPILEEGEFELLFNLSNLDTNEDKEYSFKIKYNQIEEDMLNIQLNDYVTEYKKVGNPTITYKVKENSNLIIQFKIIVKPIFNVFEGFLEIIDMGNEKFVSLSLMGNVQQNTNNIKIRINNQDGEETNIEMDNTFNTFIDIDPATNLGIYDVYFVINNEVLEISKIDMLVGSFVDLILEEQIIRYQILDSDTLKLKIYIL